MTHKALKLALEALEYWDVHGKLHQPTEEAITAIKAALAQPTSGDYALGYVEGFNDACKPKPTQEPVAWMDIDEKGSASGLRYWSEPDNRHEVALYATPPQRTWVGLTEARAKEIWLKGKDHGDDWLDVLALVRAFEAKLKELNT